MISSAIRNSLLVLYFGIILINNIGLFLKRKVNIYRRVSILIGFSIIPMWMILAMDIFINEIQGRIIIEFGGFICSMMLLKYGEKEIEKIDKEVLEENDI